MCVFLKNFLSNLFCFQKNVLEINIVLKDFKNVLRLDKIDGVMLFYYLSIYNRQPAQQSRDRVIIKRNLQRVFVNRRIFIDRSRLQPIRHSNRNFCRKLSISCC